METVILPTSSAEEEAFAAVRAAELLVAGEIVALPTETVYGLAADVLNPDAVAKIFEAKQRPLFDPLIVHLPGPEWLERIAHIPEELRELVNVLTNAFWPGPLTLVLPRQPNVPDLVTAGLETVAVRMSAQPIFASIVRQFGRPLAAPSANRFGRISPTSAADVEAELGGRIPLVIDGGRTTHGIESTVIALHTEGMIVLRPGPITIEQLRMFADAEVAGLSDRPLAPGQLASHYAPATPLILVEDAASYSPGARCGLLTLRSSASRPEFALKKSLTENGDLREAAANLFRLLRELDAANLDLIVAENLVEEGLGAAIMDRLRRAAAIRRS